MPRFSLIVSIAALCFMLPGSAFALSTKDCSVKYQAAKQAGTLNGQKWNDFRKAECGAGPDKATETVPNPMSPSATTTPPPAPAPAPAPRSTATASKPAPAPTATGSAVFPRAIDPKYASLSPGKGRMQTCLDQYKANKASSGNGGMTWIQKGGGYYSMCNRQLKG